MTLLLATLAGLLASASAAQLPASRGEPDGDRLVALELVCARASIAPGERVRLGAKLAIERGWHVYWTNPGDAGAPTTLRLAAPQGFEVGEPRFPGPLRFESAGEITSYGYRDELLVVIEVLAPRTLQPGTRARFVLDARWLVCEEVCLPGSGKAELELEVVAADAPRTPSAAAPLFERWQPRMPRPQRELAGLRARWLASEPLELELSVAGARELELFPARHPVLELVEQRATSDEHGTRLLARYRLRSAPYDGPLVVAGLLRVREAEGESFHELALPLTSAEHGTGSTPPAGGGAPGSETEKGSPQGGVR